MLGNHIEEIIKENGLKTREVTRDIDMDIENLKNILNENKKLN
jgi:hypothetical protein